MPLVEVLNRYPSRRSGLHHWPGLVAATLMLVGGVSVAAWPGTAVPGAFLALIASAALLLFSWCAPRIPWGRVPAFFAAAEPERTDGKNPGITPGQILENPWSLVEQML